MSLSSATKLYILAVAAMAGAVMALSAVISPSAPLLVGVILFGLAVFLSENFAVKLPKAGTVSVSFTIIMAAAVIYGPLSASLSALANAVVYRDLQQRTSPWRWLFNAAQYSLSSAMAGLFYVWTGGLVLSWQSRPFVLADFPFQLLPAAVFSAVFFLLNSVLVSQVIALNEQVSFGRVWFANVQGVMFNYLAFAPLALAVADIYMRFGYLGLLLMIMPLAVARQTFQIYISLKEAYWGTVQSLIAALEAKDPYTSGHSQRVAELSEKVGRRMKLDDKSMTLLHYAATLHDIGKIGTEPAILRKPGKLTDDEQRAIRLHPESGALILQEVDFLRDVVPIVFHHHERVDGCGYGDGLQGEEIPLLSRILAVADAFDAMTSPRPYRDPLSSAEALKELRRCSGTQFDAKVVELLIECWSDGDQGPQSAHAGEVEQVG